MKITEKTDGGFHIIDSSKNIDCVYKDGRLKGKGSRTYREEIIEKINKKINNEVNDVIDQIADNNKQQRYIEMFALSDLINSWGYDKSLNSVSVRDLHKWQSNPIKYNKEIRNLSMYYYGQKGIITEVYEMYKTLPNLNSVIYCSNPNGDKYEKYLKKIKAYDSYICKPSLIRTIIFHAVAEGTVIGYIYNDRYIQLLDLDIYKPARLKNNRWEVDCDLSYFDKLRSSDKTKILNSQPPEVKKAYLKYYNSKDKSKNQIYTLNINNTFVIKIRSKYDESYGRPVGLAAFDNLLHKELLKEAEKAVVNRIISTLLTLKMGEEGKEGYHPTKDQAEKVYNAVKNVLNDDNKNGIKLVGIPYWAQIEALKVDLGIFDDKKYTQIDKDILTDLGVSSTLLRGDGGTYSSGNLNKEIFFSKIFEILEQIEEEVFNIQYRRIISDDDYIFTKKFSRSTTLDSESRIKILEKLSDKGGSLKPLIDEAGYDFEEYIQQVKYEQEKLELRNLFIPYKTSHTQSGEDEGGRPPIKNPENPSTDNSKANDSNNNPRT